MLNSFSTLGSANSFLGTLLTQACWDGGSSHLVSCTKKPWTLHGGRFRPWSACSSTSIPVLKYSVTSHGCPPTERAKLQIMFPWGIWSLGSIRRGADISHPHDTWPSRDFLPPQKHSAIFKATRSRFWQGSGSSRIRPHPVCNFHCIALHCSHMWTLKKNTHTHEKQNHAQVTVEKSWVVASERQKLWGLSVMVCLGYYLVSGYGDIFYF